VKFHVAGSSPPQIAHVKSSSLTMLRSPHALQRRNSNASV
jgi:hypothetical protein